jgi:hypothetical protein
VVKQERDEVVAGISDVHGSDLWIKGGYFTFRSAIFDYLDEGEDLFEAPIQRLIAHQNLETLHEGGRPPCGTSGSSGRVHGRPTAGRHRCRMGPRRRQSGN